MKVIKLPNSTAVISDFQYEIYEKIKAVFEAKETYVLYSHEIKKRLPELTSSNYGKILTVLIENGLLSRPRNGFIKLNNINN